MTISAYFYYIYSVGLKNYLILKILLVKMQAMLGWFMHICINVCINTIVGYVCIYIYDEYKYVH